MSDSGKIDLLCRAVFGDIDDETLKQNPGLVERFATIEQRLSVIMYGGAITSIVVVLHFLGAPTQIVWSIASKAVAVFAHP